MPASQQTRAGLVPTQPCSATTRGSALSSASRSASDERPETPTWVFVPLADCAIGASRVLPVTDRLRYQWCLARGEHTPVVPGGLWACRGTRELRGRVAADVREDLRVGVEPQAGLDRLERVLGGVEDVELEHRDADPGVGIARVLSRDLAEGVQRIGVAAQLGEGVGLRVERVLGVGIAVAGALGLLEGCARVAGVKQLV